MKKISYALEGSLLAFLFAVLRFLPLDTASALGGWVARGIGPLLPAHRTARKNLMRAMPELGPLERRKILKRMWDNLGRVGAELPHLPFETIFKRMHVTGLENLPKPGESVIFVSGHFGNWELSYPIAFNNGVPITLIYRHVNNPHVDKLIADMRKTRSTNMFPKGPKGAIKLGRALKNGETLAMLVDQKMNDGMAIPFFGRDAMTAPAVAQLALRYDMPIIPARVVRTHGAHFDATIYPPLAFEKTGDVERDTRTILTAINQMLEGWIREYPEQWFWVHKRWPS